LATPPNILGVKNEDIYYLEGELTVHLPYNPPATDKHWTEDDWSALTKKRVKGYDERLEAYEAQIEDETKVKSGSFVKQRA